MPQVDNASLHAALRAFALVSELAASCCREGKSRVTTPTAMGEVVNGARGYIVRTFLSRGAEHAASLTHKTIEQTSVYVMSGASL